LGVVTLHNKEKKHEKLYIKFIKAGTWQAWIQDGLDTCAVEQRARANSVISSACIHATWKVFGHRRGDVQKVSSIWMGQLLRHPLAQKIIHLLPFLLCTWKSVVTGIVFWMTDICSTCRILEPLHCKQSDQYLLHCVSIYTECLNSMQQHQSVLCNVIDFCSTVLA
jgi:hypothetical protein